MSNGYTIEKLYDALRELSLSTESLQQRLLDAWMPALQVLSADDFPKDSRRKFEELSSAMESALNEQGGSLKVNASSMTDEDAKKWIETICGFILDIEETP